MAAVLVLVACGGDDQPTTAGPPISVAVGSTATIVATVGSTAITEADLNAELNAIGANAAYVDETQNQLVAQGSGVRQAGGGFDPGFVRSVLTRRITFVLIHDEVVRRGLDGTACRGVAEQRLPVQLAGGDPAKGARLLATFDAAYRDQLVAWNADLLALQAALVAASCMTPLDQQEAGPAYASWRDDALAAVPVTVDARYGHWDQPSGTVVR